MKDTVADGACAELWMDFTTRPHHHHDAYVVRTCGRDRSGWGRYHKVLDPRIHGVRAAVCTYGSHGTGWPPERLCSDQWPHQSARAGTYREETV